MNGGHVLTSPTPCPCCRGESLRWEDVTKSWPDAQIEVIVANADGDVFSGVFDGETWWTDGGMSCVDGITHWSNYPKHPKDIK